MQTNTLSLSLVINFSAFVISVRYFSHPEVLVVSASSLNFKKGI